ncbi:MAG: hypothetical protein Q7T11_01065, partial [Deltaproteobacteria bacterium]|nr:hypothetical protein [Deltaproteobacteria bacterium]
MLDLVDPYSPEGVFTVDPGHYERAFELVQLVNALEAEKPFLSVPVRERAKQISEILAKKPGPPREAPRGFPDVDAAFARVRAQRATSAAPSPVYSLVYLFARISDDSPLHGFLRKGFVRGDSLDRISKNPAAVPVFLRERLTQVYVSVLPDVGGAVFRDSPGFHEISRQLIQLIDDVEKSGTQVIKDDDEKYAKLKLKTASYFSYGVFDPVSFETEVALMARLLPPEAPVVEIQLNIENIQTIARSKLKESITKGLEGHRVGAVRIRFHDQKTNLDLEDHFVMDESIPAPPITISTDVVHEGRGIVHDIMGEEALDVLSEVEGQVPAVQERFWLEMKGLQEVAKPLLKVSNFGADRGKYYAKKGGDAKGEIKSIVEYLHSLSEPIQRGGHFRRANATPEEVFVFQRDFKPTSDPAKTTSFNFLSQTYVLPEWVQEKMDKWINQKSDFLRTETSGYFTFEVRDGVTVITDFIPKASTSQSVEYDIEAGIMSRESIGDAYIRSTAPGGRVARIIGFDNDPKWKIPVDQNKAIKVHSHFTDSHYHHSPSPGDFGQLGPDGQIRKSEHVAVEAVRTPGLGLIFYQRGNNDRPYQTVIEKPLVSVDSLPEVARGHLSNLKTEARFADEGGELVVQKVGTRVVALNIKINGQEHSIALTSDFLKEHMKQSGSPVELSVTEIRDVSIYDDGMVRAVLIVNGKRVMLTMADGYMTLVSDSTPVSGRRPGNQGRPPARATRRPVRRASTAHVKEKIIESGVASTDPTSSAAIALVSLFPKLSKAEKTRVAREVALSGTSSFPVELALENLPMEERIAWALRVTDQATGEEAIERFKIFSGHLDRSGAFTICHSLADR